MNLCDDKISWSKNQHRINKDCYDSIEYREKEGSEGRCGLPSGLVEIVE